MNHLMIPLGLALTLINLAAAMWLFALYRRRRLPPRAKTDQRRNRAPNAHPSRPSTAATRLICVEILNPMELATRESAAARLFGAMNPELVKREVYRQVSRRLHTQLREQGVLAIVQVHDNG